MANLEDIFTHIVEKCVWCGDNRETPCGPGSFYAATEPIIHNLPRWIQKHSIKKIADLGCGDFHWMSRVDLGNAEYDGYDIVKSTCDVATEKYGKPTVRFHHVDVLKAPLPQADLMICKDVLNHLPTSMILAMLARIRQSRTKFFAATTFPGHHNGMEEIPIGEWHRLDLSQPPYMLGSPAEGVLTNDVPPKLFALWILP